MADDGVVVYKRGEPSVPGLEDNIGAILQAVALDDLKVEFYKLNKHLEKQEFEGGEEQRLLSVTEKVEIISFLVYSPFSPLIKLSLHNYGPDTAYYRLNELGDWIPLKMNETDQVNYSGADRRIELLSYKCALGETASVRVLGKY